MPPDNVRPGQVGTLIDEQANLLDVTATIVDLAVRGHLRITEIEGAHNEDYELVRTDGGKGVLLPYEQELYDALFATGPDVKLSDLKYKFTSELAGVKNASVRRRRHQRLVSAPGPHPHVVAADRLSASRCSASR